MKKIVIKRFLAIIVFVCLVSAILYRIQWVVKPNFGNTQGTLSGFEELDRNTVDVLFLGSSNMFHSISPIVLYQRTGITSFDWGSSSQSLNMTYMYLKEALKTQQPKVVCVEVLKAFGDHNYNLYEPGMRWGFTYFPLGINMLNGLNVQTEQHIDEEYMSYIFPLLRYKDRWKELKKDDFVKHTDKYLLGAADSSTIKEISYGEQYWEDVDCAIDLENLESLDAICELCQEYGILQLSIEINFWKTIF